MKKIVLCVSAVAALGVVSFHALAGVYGRLVWVERQARSARKELAEYKVANAKALRAMLTKLDVSEADRTSLDVFLSDTERETNNVRYYEERIAELDRGASDPMARFIEFLGSQARTVLDR